MEDLMATYSDHEQRKLDVASGRELDKRAKAQRLFIGVYPAGIVYADRHHEVAGDYVRLGFLSYATLELEVKAHCPPDLHAQIKDHAATLQARRGELYQTSQSGQTVKLGGGT
jgi:hypothetical protein